MPRMPEVDIRDDIQAIFSQARQFAIPREQLALLTPGRNLISVPCPRAGTMQPQVIQPIAQIVPPMPPQNITVIAYSEVAVPDTKQIAAVIPFLGYLVGMGYLGHNVIIFEGHPSALAAGCRDANLVIVDAGMTPHLQADWREVIFQAMPKPVILVFEMGGRLQFLRPDDPPAEVAFQKAIDAAERGQTDAAVRLLDEALRHNPQMGQAYFMRGTIHQNEGRLDAAIEDFKNTMRVDPEALAAYNRMAQVFEAKGDLPAAVHCLEQILKKAPRMPAPDRKEIEARLKELQKKMGGGKKSWW